jgi:CrcB protein
MNRNILLVAIGSMLGGVARYLATLGFARTDLGSFPIGTFAVNIAGCLAIGIVIGLSERFEWFSPDLRLFLATGFCGGFTTFSAFAVENVSLLANRDLATFALYSGLSFVVGLLAVFAGMAMTRA